VNAVEQHEATHRQPQQQLGEVLCPRLAFDGHARSSMGLGQTHCMVSRPSLDVKDAKFSDHSTQDWACLEGKKVSGTDQTYRPIGS
jgi:hypothetical protein